MPRFEAFRDLESGAAILARELTHWAKPGKRLARVYGRVRQGGEVYDREELVAELGAAFFCADLGLTPEVREAHAAYIDSRIEVLKRDTRAIFSTVAHAQPAADFLRTLQPKASEENQPAQAA